MKRYLVALGMLALAAPAMAKDLAASLPGTWRIDMAAMFEADPPPFYKMATPEKQKEILADAVKSAPQMVLELTATTASMRSGTDAPQVASYKVTKQDTSTVWVDLVPPAQDGKAAPAQKFTFQFVDPNTVKMLKEGDPAAVVLKRSK
jgi:hypothetical protein